jgi:hypothetical protein
MTDHRLVYSLPRSLYLSLLSKQGESFLSPFDSSKDLGFWTG